MLLQEYNSTRVCAMRRYKKPTQSGQAENLRILYGNNRHFQEIKTRKPTKSGICYGRDSEINCSKPPLPHRRAVVGIIED